MTKRSAHRRRQAAPSRDLGNPQSPCVSALSVRPPTYARRSHGSRNPTPQAARPNSRRSRDRRWPGDRRRLRRAARPRARGGRRGPGAPRRGRGGDRRAGARTASRPEPTPSSCAASSRRCRGRSSNVFAERARETAEKFGRQVEDVFGPESGHVTKLLQRHFGDESSSAVQNRVREMLQEVGAKQREDIMRLFSSADGSNPLAQFTARTVATLKDAGERQDRNLLQLQERMALLPARAPGAPRRAREAPGARGRALSAGNREGAHVRGARGRRRRRDSGCSGRRQRRGGAT